MMRRLIIDAPEKVRVEEAERPVPGANEVLVRVAAAGICGSDVHGYLGVNGRRPAGTVMGHEAAGQVAEVGPGVDRGLVGTRVAINPVVSCGSCDMCAAGSPNLCRTRRLYGCTPELPGAFAEWLVVLASNAFPLADGVAAERAALVEPLSVGAHAARVGATGPGDRVLVVGGGPIGIAAALGARRRGADVTVSEPEQRRRELLGRLDVPTVEPSAVRAEQADVVLECVGFPQTLRAALQGARPGGRVVLVGLADEQPPIDAAALVMGERQLVGSAVYTPADFAEVTEWVGETDLPLDALIETQVDLDGLPGAFAAYAAGSLHSVKTLLRLDTA